jgi:acetylornithine deacetylase/succinyl-diaminopimelate desuccinylase-like protein
MAITDDVFSDGCTLSVGVISGGVKNNIVPDFCRLVCDFRLVPGITAPETFFADLVARASAALGFTVELLIEDISPAMHTATEHPLVESIRATLRQHGLNDTPDGVAYCTDGGRLSAKGFPCVVMGPGNIAVAHSAVEYLELDQFQLAGELYVDVAQRFAKQARTC